MVPAVGIVSLFWVLSCLSLTKSAVYEPTECCECDTLMPSKIPNDMKPQIMPSPFKIRVKESQYSSVDEIHVDLVSTNGDPFRAFFLGAYAAPYEVGHKPVGQMKLLADQDFQTREDCSSVDGSVSQSRSAYAILSQDDKPKRMLKFVWHPARYYGHIEFRATFVVNDFVFWVSEKSELLRDPTKGPLPQQYRPPAITSISTEGCGVSKGCFREPAGCIEPHCMYILTWEGDTQFYEFELGGLGDGSNDRYVAVGLSDDTYMGKDTVFACAHDSATESTEVYFSYNEEDEKKNIPIQKYKSPGSYDYMDEIGFLQHEEGSYSNGRLRCRFKVQRDLNRHHSKLRSLRGGPVHLLFAHGFAIGGKLKRHGLGVEHYPVASERKILFSSYTDSSERASYPLAKAHGCLMILAWIFFASIGLLLTKYYKPMWPNKSMFRQRYWFLGHFNFMSMMFIISIIGIILIFVEAGGYSKAPDLPQKAHPILGIIILVCIVINPILALLRPNSDHDCRPVFNWFHWAFGTIANVLAIPQIFIGMDFGKVFVPWWATWILVIWVIFHIIVELTLEIHQCCTYKKNKERRKKHEQLKREYPKQHHPEPEPAGRRFKRFMLLLHFGITTLITIIMIIIIAVS